MVRLEKIAYEKIVNSQVLGRSRALESPRKWFYVNPYVHNRKMAHHYWENNFLIRLLRPLIKLYTRKQHAYEREILLQKGYAPEDKFLHSDAELRRSIIFAHYLAENCHPYHLILKDRRRERYHKVEIGVPGFSVPDYIRAEAEQETYYTVNKLRTEWNNFIHQNYYSDMTPTTRQRPVTKFLSFEWFNFFGLAAPDAWSRLFFNERDVGWFSEKEYAETLDRKKWPFNLTTAQGKKQLEAHVKQMNQDMPGYYSPPGEEFNFKQYYQEIGV